MGESKFQDQTAARADVDSTTAATPRISVVTVAWNGLELIRLHLRALDVCRRSLPGGLEVIVVDNASSDGTPEAIAHEFPWVRLVRNAQNLGFARGCGQGLELARGEYLLLLNPDCESTLSALSAMADFLATTPTAGAVGCRLLYPDGTPQIADYRDPKAGRYLFTHSLISPVFLHARRALRILLSCISGLSPEKQSRRPPVRCDWLMGACIMVPRQVYETVGTLDPGYFMYSEDADWCRRIRAAGYGVYSLPSVSIVHRQKQSSSKTREFTYVRLYRSLLMYCLRHMDEAGVRSMRRMVLLDMKVRSWIFPILGFLLPRTWPLQDERLRATQRVIHIWRRLDPLHDPDPPPQMPHSTP